MKFRTSLTCLLGALMGGTILTSGSLVREAVAGTGTITVKDAAGNTQTYFIITNGSSQFLGAQTICDGAAGANCAAVVASSASVTATSPALAVGISPNSNIVAATESGTWNVGLNSGTNTIGAISNTSITANQATAANLNATVVGTGTFAVQAGQTGTWNIGTVSTITSISASALPTGAATSANQPTNVVSSSTTSGQTGNLAMGAVTTGAPSYTSGQSNNVSLDTSGSLRVNCTTGCGGGTGGTAIADEATFTQGTTQFTPVGGIFNSSISNLTSGQAGAVQLTNTRRLVDQNPDIGTVGSSATCTSTASATLVQCFYQFHQDLTASIPAGTNNIGNVGSTISAAVPVIGMFNAGLAVNAEPAAQSSGTLTAMSVGLEGKLITLPYANKENFVSGAASATTTSSTVIVASAGAGLKNYITSLQCGRSDAGTTSVVIAFNDLATTSVVIPNGGGGGGTNISFPVPLRTSASTSFNFTAATSISTVYCSAQGYKGA